MDLHIFLLVETNNSLRPYLIHIFLAFLNKPTNYIDQYSPLGG